MNLFLENTPSPSPRNPLEKGSRIAILGSGIAGQVMAFKLARAGYDPLVIEAEEQPGEGASGNAVSLLHPRLSLESSLFHRFMVAAFLRALDFYDHLPPKVWQSRGLLQLALKASDERHIKRLAQTPELSPGHICFLSPDETSQKAGLPLSYTSLYYPYAGSLLPGKLRDHLLCHSELLCSSPVTAVRQGEGNWEILGEQNTLIAKVGAVILCQGMGVKSFDPGLLWPLHPVKGQLAVLKATQSTQILRCPLVFQHYVTPVFEGCHLIGASFEKGATDHRPDARVEQNLLSSVKTHLSPFHDNSLCQKSPFRRSRLRACLPDFLPLAGPVIPPKLFIKSVQKPVRGGWRWPDIEAPYHLYVLAGLGSHGFLTAPYLADHILEDLTGEKREYGQDLAYIIHPSRFLMKAIKQNKIIHRTKT